MKTTTEQKEILKVLTENATPKPVEKPSNEIEVVIPDWHTIASTYTEALQKVLNALKATRPFVNYREGQIDDKHIREFPTKAEAFKKMKAKDGFYTLKVQMGEKFKGVSVEDARNQMTGKEFPLGAYEIGCILLTHPEILQKYEDLWIDCAGDEYSYSAAGVFPRSLYFYFGGGFLEFGRRYVDFASDYYGSVSGFFPQ